MFGHQDNKQDNHAEHDNRPAEEEFTSGAHPTGDTPTDTDHVNKAGDDSNWQHPGKPVDSAGSMNDVVPAAGGSSTPVSVPAPDHSADDSEADNVSDGADNELVAIKHQAVEALSPLVDKLDQSAEERFRTLMMMVQATDNQSLLPQAYEAAKKIDNEEARAQALLDVINEVNYFTHPKNGKSED